MNKTKEIIEIINTDLKAVQKQKKITIFFGSLIMIVLFSYFIYITTTLNKYLNTSNLSNILTVSIKNAFAETYPKVESQLILSIPQMVKNLKKQTLSSLIAKRVSSNEHIKASLQEIFLRVDKILENEIKQKGSTYRSALTRQLHLIANKKTAEKEFENIDLLLEEVIFKEVEVYFDYSQKFLEKLEKQINDILTKKDLTKGEQKIKTFIKYWVNFLNSNFRLK